MSRLLQLLILAYLPLAARHLPIGVDRACGAQAAPERERNASSLLA